MRHARLMIAEPKGMFAEAIRGMRREIDVRRDRQSPTVILVASSLPGEGKTLVASNLAHTYALTGVRTLLIDADLRKANLTRALLSRLPGRGLRDTLERGGSMETAILRDHATGLCYLPSVGATPVTTQASELLSSPRLAQGLAQLRRHFDVIVIDAAPLLPVVDARILADQADQIVFVMAWRKTPKKLAQRAVKCLGRNERKIAGFVLNQVDPGELSENAVYAEPTGRHDRMARAA